MESCYAVRMFIGFTLTWTGVIVAIFVWPIGLPMIIIGVIWFVGAIMNKLAVSAANQCKRYEPDEESDF